MSLPRFLARPMFAAPFIVGGVETLRHPEPRVKKAEKVAPVIAGKVGLPTDTELLVKVNAGIQVASAALLAIGRFRRLSSATLLASLIPTTAAAHRFWEEDDEGTAATQRAHFLKNVALAGGLLHELFDPDPAAVRRRARRLAKAKAAATAAGKGAKVTAAGTRAELVGAERGTKAAGALSHLGSRVRRGA